MRPKTSIVLMILSLSSPGLLWAEDATYVYAVQIQASVQSAPAQITLQWQPDPYDAESYMVYRKTKFETDWGTGTLLPGNASTYTDGDVAPGRAYEYRIVKAGTLGYTGYGYIYTGINAPLTEDRGVLILIVASDVAGSLASELARLESDLIGDGWRVRRHDVSRNDSPEIVKSLIISDYNSDPANVSAVFLFGHVPILQSGYLNYDGHLTRSMPADAFYGDIDGDWLTDQEPSSRPSFLPSDVELMVGRVDLSNMPGNGAAIAWPSETELLRNYLNKDHRWRHKQMNVQARALMGNLRGDENGEATAASGYRNFDPLVGAGKTFKANVEYAAPPEQRWVSMLSAGSYVWAYGCGAGQPTAVSGLGTSDGTFYDVRSIDIVGQDAQAVFVMLFGSWFGQWDFADDLLRSVLATPTMGLAACMAGRPHWFFHHMGLGETIGYSTRLSMNNDSLYQSQSNGMTRAVYIALMGDPSLRMYPVAPATGLILNSTGARVDLAWTASADAVPGYHVYRAPTPSGPFTRLTGALISGTTYTDPTVPISGCTYMVRAVTLQSTPSGTFYNPSQGVFASVIAGSAIFLQANRNNNDLVLTWNSQPGTTYRVLSTINVPHVNWTDISGTITATANTTSWSTPINFSDTRRYYRIAGP